MGCLYAGGPVLLVGGPLEMASPSRGLNFTSGKKEKPAIRAGSLSRVTRANYIYFPRKPQNPIFAYKFSFYNLGINKRNL